MKLMDSLNKYLLDQNPAAARNNPYDMERTLNDFLTNDTIQLMNRVKNWEEAIRRAAQPLLNRRHIEESYVDAVMENCRRNSDYIMLGNRIAIPHAKPEEGVLKLGMSLLNLKEPVEFPNGQRMNLICFIAAEDKEKHINPLLQLRRLAEDESTVNQIKKSRL